MAEMASAQARGEKVDHPLASQAMDLLCESVHRMVYKLACGYSVTCRVDVDDLAQDCMKRIVQRIDSFDSRLAKFTTWATTVCRSVLNGIYRRQSNWNKNMVNCADVSELGSEFAPKEQPDETGLARMDIFGALKILVRKYPKRRRLLMGFFGHPGRKGFVCPSRVMVTESAKVVGISYVAARTFYREVVEPFFADHFSMTPAPEPVEEQAGVRKSKVVAAAVSVLVDAKRPMRAKELFDVSVNRGLYESKAGNPFVSFTDVLTKALKRGEKRVVRVGPGYWAAAGVGGVSGKPGRSRVVEAALIVLKGAEGPMSADVLYEKVVAKRLYVSDAKDPFTSFFSVLGKAVGKGETRICRAGKTAWGVPA